MAQLRARRVGAAVVSRDGRSIDGVITERHVIYALDIHGVRLHAMPVSELVTGEVIACAPHETVATKAGQVQTLRRAIQTCSKLLF